MANRHAVVLMWQVVAGKSLMLGCFGAVHRAEGVEIRKICFKSLFVEEGREFRKLKHIFITLSVLEIWLKIGYSPTGTGPSGTIGIWNILGEQNTKFS